MADQLNDWKFVKTARYPSMFQKAIGQYKSLHGAMSGAFDSFEKFLETSDFRQQRKAIQKTLLENGVSTMVQIFWGQDNDSSDPTERMDSLHVRISLSARVPAADRSEMTDKMAQIGQNMFDARPNLKEDQNSRTWIFRA